jgi:hypothetical protein
MNSAIRPFADGAAARGQGIETNPVVVRIMWRAAMF